MLSSRALISTTYVQEMPLSPTKKVELINAASDIFTGAVGVNYFSDTYVEYVDVRGNYTQDVRVRHTPITAISEVELNGTVLESDEFFYDADSGVVSLLGGRIWSADNAGAAKISYTAGYALGAAPFDIQQAVKSIVTSLVDTQAPDDPLNVHVFSKIAQDVIDRRKRLV